MTRKINSSIKRIIGNCYLSKAEFWLFLYDFSIDKIKFWRFFFYCHVHWFQAIFDEWSSRIFKKMDKDATTLQSAQDCHSLAIMCRFCERQMRQFCLLTLPLTWKCDFSAKFISSCYKVRTEKLVGLQLLSHLHVIRESSGVFVQNSPQTSSINIELLWPMSSWYSRIVSHSRLCSPCEPSDRDYRLLSCRFLFSK